MKKWQHVEEPISPLFSIGKQSNGKLVETAEFLLENNGFNQNPEYQETKKAPGFSPQGFETVLQIILENSESIAAGILCCIAKRILDPEKLIVLSKPVGAAH